jgi:hypothetical protein
VEDNPVESMQLAFKIAFSLVEYSSARLDNVSPGWKIMAIYPAGGIHAWLG